MPVGPTEGDRAGSVEALVTHMAEFERAETGARPSHSFEANARRRPSNQRQQRDQATWRRIIGETTTIPICSGRRSFPGWPQCRCPGYGGDGHVSLDGIEGPGRPPNSPPEALEGAGGSGRTAAKVRLGEHEEDDHMSYQPAELLRAQAEGIRLAS